MKKYGSLKWIDLDNKFSLRVAHPNMMNFNKHRGDNTYNIFATTEGYELNILHVSQSYLYDVWVTDTDFFEQVINNYNNNNGVKCYEEGGDRENYEEQLVNFNHIGMMSHTQ